MLSERFAPLTYRGKTIEVTCPAGYYVYDGVVIMGDLIGVLFDIDTELDGTEPGFINDEYMTPALWDIVNAQSQED